MSPDQKLNSVKRATGLRLAKAAKAADASQTWLAEVTGINQTTISAFMRGAQRMYVDQAADLAQAIGVSLDVVAYKDPPSVLLDEGERELLAKVRESGVSPQYVLGHLVASGVLPAPTPAASASSATSGAKPGEALEGGGGEVAPGMLNPSLAPRRRRAPRP